MRVKIPEKLRIEVQFKSNNRCCVCQTPFIVFHHIDGDPTNNDISNIAPLCPNCHSQAHSKGTITNNLTNSRIIALRDKWYAYCEGRKELSNVGVNALLKLKNFIHSRGYADHSWNKMFSLIDPSYGELSREEIIDSYFSTSNRDDLITGLETVKNMYPTALTDPNVLDKFKTVCFAFGINYDELI